MAPNPFKSVAEDAVTYAVKLVTAVNTEQVQGETATGLRQFTADSMVISDNLSNNMNTMNTRIQQYSDRMKMLAQEAHEKNLTKEERDGDEKTVWAINQFASGQGKDEDPSPVPYIINYGGESVNIPAGTPRSQVKAQQDKLIQTQSAKLRDWERLSGDFRTMRSDLESAIGGIPSEDWIQNVNGGVRPPLPNSAVLSNASVRSRSDFLPADFQSGSIGAIPTVGGKSIYEFSQDPTPLKTSADDKTKETADSSSSSSSGGGGGGGGVPSGDGGGGSRGTGGDVGEPGGRSTLTQASGSTGSGGGSVDDILNQLTGSAQPTSSADTQTGLSSVAPTAISGNGTVGAAPGMPGAPGNGGGGLSTPSGAMGGGGLLGGPGANNLTQLSKADLDRMLNSGNTPSNLSSRHDNPNFRGGSGGDGTHNSRGSADRNNKDQVVPAPTPIPPGMAGIGRGMPGMGGGAGTGAPHGGGMGPGMMGGGPGSGASGKKDGKKIQSKEKDILGSDIPSVAPIINAAGGSSNTGSRSKDEKSED